MEKVGLFHFVAEPYLMDFRGRVTLPMIGNYLIHAASSHAGDRKSTRLNSSHSV